MNNIFKNVSIVILLFILFLWSGGIYEHSKVSDNIRYNKITGGFEVFQTDHGVAAWRTPSD